MRAAGKITLVTVWLLAISTTFAPTTIQSQSVDSIDAIVESRIDSVVRVIGQHVDGSTCYGTGVFIGDRYVVTAKHVLRDCRLAAIETNAGEKITVQQTFDCAWADQSVLVLMRRPTAIKATPIARSDPARGTTVTLAGFDAGHRLRFYDATIGTAGRYDYGVGSEVAARSVGGNSGGPVFDPAGNFVGTLWGSDGASTSLVNVAASHKFFRALSQRFPSFGVAYGAACQNQCQPQRPPEVQPPIVKPPVIEPTPPMVQPAPSQCDCQAKMDALLAALQSSQKPNVPTVDDTDIEKAVQEYLKKDPLTITMLIRNADGSIDSNATDIARVIPMSDLPPEQQKIVRESLQLQPVKK